MISASKSGAPGPLTSVTEISYSGPVYGEGAATETVVSVSVNAEESTALQPVIITVTASKHTAANARFFILASIPFCAAGEQMDAHPGSPVENVVKEGATDYMATERICLAGQANRGSGFRCAVRFP